MTHRKGNRNLKTIKKSFKLFLRVTKMHRVKIQRETRQIQRLILNKEQCQEILSHLEMRNKDMKRAEGNPPLLYPMKAP